MRVTCTIVATVPDYGGGPVLRRSFSSFHARVPLASVHARRRTRIIHVRATTEFVGHAVDRGESRTRGLNVIGRWLRTMLERCSARARLIPRVAKSRTPTYIYVLCRYDYLDCAAISLHYICIATP